MAENTTIEVPTPSGLHAVERQVTRLDERDLLLVYRFSYRTVGWHVDISDFPDIRLATGVRVKPGFNLLEFVPDLGVMHVQHENVSTPDRLAFAEARAKIWYEPLSNPWSGQP